jgi:hypothetical protein
VGAQLVEKIGADAYGRAAEEGAGLSIDAALAQAERVLQTAG